MGKTQTQEKNEKYFIEWLFKSDSERRKENPFSKIFLNMANRWPVVKLPNLK
jgi:hypothetical protein